MSHLAPCPACNRHVDVAETACPFCAVALSQSFRAQQPPAPPRGRLGRAALMAAGATLLGAAACSSPLTADAGSDRPPSATGGNGGAAGAGGPDGTGGTTARDASEDRTVIAIYGAPTPAYGLSLPPQEPKDASEPDSDG